MWGIVNTKQKKGENMIQDILNEDGTSFLSMPMLENPLAEKWAKLYPPIPKPEASQVCDDYSCMWCGRCPRGSYWQCPDEDKEIYEQYLKDKREYMLSHNPSLKKIYENFTAKNNLT